MWGLFFIKLASIFQATNFMLPIEELYQYYLNQPNVITDSRKIEPGCLFFALKGENFDGNLYAPKALELGASFAIVDDEDVIH